MAYTEAQIDAKIDAKIDAHRQAIDSSIDTKILASKAPLISAAAAAASAAIGNSGGIGPVTYPWGEAVGSRGGYLGNYIAAGQVRAGAVNSSWANVDVDQAIVSKAVRGLDIDAALALAQTLDGDIDGKSSTGTSTLKEGEELFVFGASYSGLQGVGIRETSGVSANYVKGKKVSWLAGDQWSLHKEGSAFSESDVDQMSSITKAKGAVTSQIDAEVVKNISISRLENFSYRQSAANVSSINVGSSTAEIIVAASSSNAYLNAVKVTANVALGSITGGFFVKLVDVKYAKYGMYEKKITPFIVKAEDADLNVTLAMGTKITSIEKDLTSVVTRLDKMANHLEMKDLQISRSKTSVISNDLLVEGACSAVGDWDVSLEEMCVANEVSTVTTFRALTEFKNIKTSVSSVNNSVNSGVCLNL